MKDEEWGGRDGWGKERGKEVEMKEGRERERKKEREREEETL